MSRSFKTVSSLQRYLKDSIMDSIQNRLIEVCIDVIESFIQKNVYDSYAPQGSYAYERTNDLLNCINVDNVKIGTKHATFEVFMDSSKIRAVVTDAGYWNQHASVDPIDVSQYIPMWVEEGTSGGLWDRNPSYYMEDSYFELSGGRLTRELAIAMKQQGWSVTVL